MSTAQPAGEADAETAAPRARPTATVGAPRPRRMPLIDYAAITATVLLVGLLGVLAYAARGALLLVFLGFFLATGLEPAVKALRRRGLRRGLAITVIFLAILLLTAALLAVLVIPAVHQVEGFANEVPGRLSQVGARFGAGGGPGAPAFDPAQQDQLRNALHQLATLAASSVAAIFGVLGTLVGGVFAGVTVLVLAVYFSLAMPRLLAGLTRALGREDRAGTADAALGRIGGYVSGQLIVSACAGVVSLVYFLLTGVPYPALLALVVAVFDALPQIGATLASIVGIAVALSVSLGLAVATLVFFIAYQGVENYLIAPRVFARTVEISPIAAFAAVLIGVSVAGLLGAVTALPLTAAGKVVARQVMAERRERDAGASAHPPGPPRPPGTANAAEQP